MTKTEGSGLGARRDRARDGYHKIAVNVTEYLHGGNFLGTPPLRNPIAMRRIARSRNRTVSLNLTELARESHAIADRAGYEA